MSAIEWTDQTWNPVVGCRKVSPGCLNCYAERMSLRLAKMAQADGLQGRNPGRKSNYLEVVNFKGKKFEGNVRTVPDALSDPLKWKKPRMVFVNSMSDLFHEDVPFEFIQDVWSVMARTTRHTYQILTKRTRAMNDIFLPRREDYVPLPNVWLGTSVENRQHGLPRIDILRQVPAAVRFLSIEPLLEDVGELDLSGIHWVIVGGESGPGARRFNTHWARGIRDQCETARVPFFMKQITVNGRKVPYDTWEARGWGDLTVREMP